MPIRARSVARSTPALQDVLAVQHDLALGALAGIEGVHAVQRAQQGGLAAARRADQRGDALFARTAIETALQRLGLAVEEVEVLDVELHLSGAIHVGDAGLEASSAGLRVFMSGVAPGRRCGR